MKTIRWIFFDIGSTLVNVLSVLIEQFLGDTMI